MKYKQCCLPGCENRVIRSSYWLCLDCYREYVIDGFIPPWLHYLINDAQRQFDRQHVYDEHETSLEKYFEGKDI